MKAGTQTRVKAGTQTRVKAGTQSRPTHAMPCVVGFRLHADAPEEFVAAWKTMVEALKNSNENDTVRVELHEAISQKVQATGMNDAKILKRSEGGFGGDMNECDRQIRFYNESLADDPLEIRMLPSNGDVKPLPGDPYDENPGNHKMEWTMPDLMDFKRATVMALNEYLYAKANPGFMGDMAIDAHIVFYGGDEEEKFEFYVNNYPNKNRKKRVIGTMTMAERYDETRAI